ncbi:hypothetical protein ALC53_08127, partial [Atta colombica]
QRTIVASSLCFTKRLVFGVIYGMSSNSSEKSFFECFSENCRYKSSKALVDFMINVDSRINLFKHYYVNCILEIMFLATLPNYGKRRIGEMLVTSSLELGKELKRGKNVRIPITIQGSNKVMNADAVPTLASAIMTSNYSYQIAMKLHFDQLLEVPYDEYEYNGKKYSERINSQEHRRGGSRERDSHRMRKSSRKSRRISKAWMFRTTKRASKCWKIAISSVSLSKATMLRNKYNFVQKTLFIKNPGTFQPIAESHYLRYQIESQVDVFEKYNAQGAMEIFYIGTDSKSQERGIGWQITEKSLEVARGLRTRKLKQICIADKIVNEHVRPEVVFAVAASMFSQRIMEKLNFETLAEIRYEDYVRGGKKMSDRIGNLHKTARLTARKL